MRTLALALIPWLAASALAAEPVDAGLDAAADGQVHVNAVRGEIRVVGWSEPRVTVQGTRDDNSAEFVFRRDGDTIVIEDRLEQNSRRGGKGTDLTIRIPTQSRLRVSVVSADLDVRQVLGSLRLNTVSGEVTGSDVGEDVEVSTVSGDVSLETGATRLNVRSTSGRLLVSNDAALMRGRLASVSGEVELFTRLATEADLEIENVSGAVTLTLPGPVNAALDIVAGPGARIRNQLTDAQPVRPRYGPGERLEQTLGSGSGYVRVSTVSGRIRLAGG
jgi:hypothetical protein